MQLQQGGKVFTSDGQNVGHIDRVVIDPRTKQVTHVVIRKGFLFTEDKVVPIDWLAAITEDRITLRDDAGDLQALPNFEEKHLVTVGREELGHAPSSVGYVPSLYGYPLIDLPDQPRQSYITQTERNIPEGMVALKEGAKVMSADDKHVGNVECILTDPQADRATYLLISKGLLLRERKLVPTGWVNIVGEDEVYLAVGSRFLDQLREYHG